MADLLRISKVLYPSNKWNKRFEIDYIKAYDGDTIQATINGEKRKIRLLMVDTPEMNYDKGCAQPYAEQAKEFIEKAKKV
ncbi:thermonuclease family protein [Lysinibacillus cavernae]|uniref:thermonuclease family protein n=1 Tax=Lysinibacillus cavernae TaxID=2666135 RepID=UPI001E3C0016|nr:thermonuclease family protein [Lysinibacillus cavernae]